MKIYCHTKSQSFLGELVYPNLVLAFDIEEGVGYTPQDWNPSWVPTDEKKVSPAEFRKVVKEGIKIHTTHFVTRWILDETIDMLSD